MNKSLVWTSILSFTALVSIPVAAQSVTTKGVKGAASASDTNIQSDNIKNSKNQTVPAPEKKGGLKSRGLNGTCNIHVNNSTGLYITFYFNGNPAGAMGPWGDLYPNITPGMAVLYARAVFTDGSVLTFGPRQFTCTGTDVAWTLTP